MGGDGGDGMGGDGQGLPPETSGSQQKKSEGTSHDHPPIHNWYLTVACMLDVPGEYLDYLIGAFEHLERTYRELTENLQPTVGFPWVPAEYGRLLRQDIPEAAAKTFKTNLIDCGRQTTNQPNRPVWDSFPIGRIMRQSITHCGEYLISTSAVGGPSPAGLHDP